MHLPRTYLFICFFTFLFYTTFCTAKPFKYERIDLNNFENIHLKDLTIPPSLSLNCNTNGFSGTYMIGVAMTAANKFSVTITNNSFCDTNLTFSPSDLSLSGVSGLTVTSVSPSSAILFWKESIIIEYTLGGVPNSGGSSTITGTFTYGGLSCENTVTMTDLTISSLDCAGAIHTGSLFINTNITSGVTSSISYTGGNGNSHNGQTVASTGVTGLTATLAPGNFNNGSGVLLYNITGTPATTGMATFAINIGGKTCNLTRTILIPSYPKGKGALSGKICFDISESNNNINSCSALSARKPNRANFNQIATNTQTYTFTPSGTVSNVRFYFENTNGEVIKSITGGNSGNNINTAQTLTVVYNTKLSSLNPSSPSTALALGLTKSNPLTANIYVVYNDGATKNGIDKQLMITPTVKDCVCCGAPTNTGGWLEFMCHNLGADETADPFTPSWQLNGAYIQWGKRGPTGDWQTQAHNGSLGFAAAPTGNTVATANNGTITSWSRTEAADGSWNVNESKPMKTTKDPCPNGYRVPTRNEWLSIYSASPIDTTVNWITIGTWTDSATNYSSGKFVNFSLFLPATGSRLNTGEHSVRGYVGYYVSSTEHDSNPQYFYRFFISSSTVSIANHSRLFGSSVRCVAE